MKDHILKINGPIRSLLVQMYTARQYYKHLFVIDERKYHALLADLKILIEEKYLSISRHGKKIDLKILKKGQKEINCNLT